MSETHRLSIDISQRQKEKLDNLMEHGMRKVIFHRIIDDLVELCDQHGAGIVIGALVGKAIGVREICKLKVED